MRTTTALLLTLAVLGSGGCYYDNEEELYPNNFCDTTNVTYSGTVDAIIQGKCAIPGCHVSGGNGTGDFTSFSALSQQVANGRVLRSIKRDPAGIPMPPSGGLRDCEVRQIELWIAAGAANN
ncbi:MAG: hypothetical protein JNM62_10310 [Flavobacteriales bacterium]|nr:hypothetical protein [Flavobacteriales bacterium]